jgi:xanthine/CO dehydrogenase XdhC/CoxF family maturation factor
MCVCVRSCAREHADTTLVWRERARAGSVGAGCARPSFSARPLDAKPQTRKPKP